MQKDNFLSFFLPQNRSTQNLEQKNGVLLHASVIETMHRDYA